MATADSPHLRKVKYRAKNNKTSSGTAKWEVGVDKYSQGKITSFEAQYFGHLTRFQAENIAEALNKAVDKFIDDNDLVALDKPFLTRIPDPNDPTMKTVPFDRLAQWLTATDKLPEVWTGSLVNEIKRIRAAVEQSLEKARNVTYQRDPDGTWHIYLRP